MTRRETIATPPLPATPLTALEAHGDFIARHIGPGPDDIASMLDSLGLGSLHELIDTVMPAGIRETAPLDLPRARHENETLARLAEMAGRNRVLHNMIGLGYHDTITPAALRRNLLANPGWYTAYTPYQAEISQGRLEALLNYQQMVIDLTALPLANASLLDEPTAAAEAMAMLHRLDKHRRRRFIVDRGVLPQTLAVLETRAEYLGITIDHRPLAAAVADPEPAFGVLLSYPAADGALGDPAAAIALARAHDLKVAMATDLLALTLLTPPGELGADIAFGSAQRFGIPLWCGGPHAAFFATRDEYKRQVPGRIIGVSRDRHGRPALRMALQTREQHIRRDKAMSNICTAQALLAIAAGFYAIYHGPEGLTRQATRIHRVAQLLAAGLAAAGHRLRHLAYFDTVFIEVTGQDRLMLLDAAEARGINLRRDDQAGIGITINEATRREHIAALLEVFACPTALDDLDQALAVEASAIPAALRRTSPFLEHPVFNRQHSETELLRYLKKLENRDLSLTRAMIPLGSCTMKLNAAAEMEAITWPGFAQIHPYAPAAQQAGYAELVAELEKMLAACTGYDAVSLQPNAGSQGEYAGLLAIRKYHESRGEGQRDICLIPQSAHGTNPASAHLAGFEIVVVGCDRHGNIDLEALRALAAEHRTRLAALMITYPSTHGVFEQHIREVCAAIHDNGGQVYLDGANLNALVGFAAPGRFGADVSHLNLHKTFCIPHGGGGPGVGPVCVRAHLAPYLPGAPLAGTKTPVGPVAGAPWGSAGILPISWAYISMMGRDGLARATQVAILNANYIARRLAPHYPVLYSGQGGWVAHECIIDVRAFKESAGISEEDIAKRLMDYGFHAPTMSWPVPGTLMIEPTESEPRAELDRFAAALIAIRDEIRQIETGAWRRDDNPLVMAPHTAGECAGDDWPHCYPRSVAAFPEGGDADKYWPPAARIDNVYGDRHLVCSCPPPEAFANKPDETAEKQRVE